MTTTIRWVFAFAWFFAGLAFVTYGVAALPSEGAIKDLATVAGIVFMVVGLVMMYWTATKVTSTYHYTRDVRPPLVLKENPVKTGRTSTSASNPVDSEDEQPQKSKIYEL